MDPRELMKLAGDATGFMAEAVSKASMKVASQQPRGVPERNQLLTFSSLSGSLISIHSTLRNQSSQDETMSRRLPKLLEKLEAVCTWETEPSAETAHSSLSIHPYPSLHGLVYSPSQKRATYQLSLTITNFVSHGGRSVRRFIVNLDRFVSPKGTEPQLRHTEISSKDISSEPIESPDEYPADVNELFYTTLSQHLPCKCRSSETVQEHWARLKLEARVPVVQGDVQFDMSFSAQPTSHAIRWQHLRFHVPRSKQSGSVRFVQSDRSTQSSQPDVEQKPRIIGSQGDICFCKLLGEKLGSIYIRLKIMNGCLHRLSMVDPTDRRAMPTESISLTEVLEHYRISSKGKFYLAYVLAKSVWRYYNSDFMKAPWTTESVHFMWETKHATDEDSVPKIGLASPCFAFMPPILEQAKAMEHCESSSVLHRYPKVLALGILLVDICRKTVPNRDTNASPLEEQINDDFMKYNDIVRNTSWPDLDVQHKDAIRTYKDAVCKCLDPKHFHIPSSTKTPDQGIKRRRNALYTHVVLPLETLCADFGIIDKSDSLDQLSHPGPSAEVSPPAPRLLITSGNPSNPSEFWLKDFLNSTVVHEITDHFRQKRSRPRVRIAVLDTGYDAKSRFFSTPSRKNRLVKWKDFVSGESEPVDCDGHGTHVLSLAMKVAPAADVCVARIAKNTEDLQNAATNIEQAIIWATDSGQANADIVSMSFGFSAEPLVNGKPLISNAIHKAIAERHGRIIFFAAAANDGGNEQEMFPAQHAQVFSIYATNHLGVFQDFNPSPNIQGPPVFGTLGKDVSGAWLNTHDDEVCKTGTSIAAPIAAGTAATILGYVQLRLSLKKINDGIRIKSLWTKSGMESAFERFSTTIDQQRYYLYPQKLFRERNAEVRDAQLVTAANEIN